MKTEDLFFYEEAGIMYRIFSKFETFEVYEATILVFIRLVTIITDALDDIQFSMKETEMFLRNANPLFKRQPRF